MYIYIHIAPSTQITIIMTFTLKWWLRRWKIKIGYSCLWGVKLPCSLLYCRRPQDPNEGPPALYVLGFHVNPVSHPCSHPISGAPERRHSMTPCLYVSNKEAPGKCPRIVFEAVLSLDVISQIVFLSIMWGLFFRGHITHCCLRQTDGIDTVNSTLRRSHIW